LRTNTKNINTNYSEDNANDYLINSFSNHSDYIDSNNDYYNDDDDDDDDDDISNNSYDPEEPRWTTDRRNYVRMRKLAKQVMPSLLQNYKGSESEEEYESYVSDSEDSNKLKKNSKKKKSNSKANQKLRDLKRKENEDKINKIKFCSKYLRKGEFADYSDHTDDSRDTFYWNQYYNN